MKTKSILRLLFIASLVIPAACDVKDPIFNTEHRDPSADDVPWIDTQALPQGYDLTIADEDGLRRFAELVNSGGKINRKPAREAKVLQTADITLTQEWTPISTSYTTQFLGAYNGNGHTITGLTITTAPSPATDGDVFAGLFGVAEEAVLTGIHLRGVKIDVQTDNGNDFSVGSIAGFISNSTLSLCSASGMVNAVSSAANVNAGGIAGLTTYSTISRCRTGVETTAVTTHTDKGAFAGGIAGGSLGYCFILSCEAEGKPVTAEGDDIAKAGGIIGNNSYSNLIAFCRTGANAVTARCATGYSFAGGLVGNNTGYLYSCYSRMAATATGGTHNYAGAIAGNVFINAGVRPFWEKYCYGTGAPGVGTSGLDADPALGIYYETSPGSDAIFGVMKGYTDVVKSVTIENKTVYPTATRYNPAVYPAHGIEPVHVKWGPGAEVWQRGIDTKYPEINMEYGGVPNTAVPSPPIPITNK